MSGKSISGAPTGAVVKAKATGAEEPTTLTLLRFTITSEYQYDRETVLAFAKRNGIKGWGNDPENIVGEVFELTYDSTLGNELFYGLNDDSGVEFFLRREDD